MNLNICLQPKQELAAQYWHDDITEELLYGGAKYGGKSYLGCSLIFADAMAFPGTLYFIARNELNDLRKYTTESIYEVFGIWGLNPEKYLKYDGFDNYFTLPNKSKVFYISCKYVPRDPEYQRFGSLQFTRGWIEEIGQIQHDLAIINLSTTVGRWKNDIYKLKRKILFTSNPHKGYGHKNFYLPNKKNQLPIYRKYIQAFPNDNKYAAKDYIEALNRLPKNEYERLCLGNWDYDDDPTSLINYEDILSIFENDHIPDGIKYIVCDVARYGSDRAIITVWSGFKLIEYHTFAISSTIDIENCIYAMRVKHGISPMYSIADEDGVGGGVIDHCRIKGFVNNSSAMNKNYQNLKSECGYKLAEKIKEIYIACDVSGTEREKIEQELGQLKTYDSDKDNKLRILPKEKIKENIGRSPDWLDIFIMRMYFEVKIKKSVFA